MVRSSRTAHALLSGGCCVPIRTLPVPQDPGDMSQMTDLVPWVRNIAPADDGLHTPLSGLFWWAWNSNSGAWMARHSCLRRSVAKSHTVLLLLWAIATKNT